MTRDYFYRLHRSHHRPVNDLSTAVKLTNRLLRFWADGGLVYYKRVRDPQSVFSRLVPIPYCYITSWFAIALAEIRTRRIFKRRTASSLDWEKYQIHRGGRKEGLDKVRCKPRCPPSGYIKPKWPPVAIYTSAGSR